MTMHQTLTLKKKSIHHLEEMCNNLLQGNSRVQRLQVMYPLLVLLSAGSDNSETAGELSGRLSVQQVGGVPGDGRRCNNPLKSDL